MIHEIARVGRVGEDPREDVRPCRFRRRGVLAITRRPTRPISSSRALATSS